MSEFWTYHTGDLSQLKEKCEWMNEQKYQKIRGIIELCEEKEVCCLFFFHALGENYSNTLDLNTNEDMEIILCRWSLT